MKHLPIYNPDYERLMGELGKALQTKGYTRWKMNVSMVREFLFFLECKNINDIKTVKATDIVAYHEYIRERPNQRTEGGLSNDMLKHHLFSVRLFFDYLADTGQVDGSPARLPKFSVGKSKEREVLTVEEVKQLYQATVNKKERALLSLAYGCGLRRSEIEALNVGDIMLSKGMVLVRDGKNHKSRTVPLSDNVVTDLKEYIIYERGKRLLVNTVDQALLLNYLGERQGAGNLNTMLKNISLRTSIKKKVTLHILRHSIATHLLDKGADIHFIKTFLGHVCIDTSHIYSRKRKQRLNLLNAIHENH
jgi:site-specific recombinase XerD